MKRILPLLALTVFLAFGCSIKNPGQKGSGAGGAGSPPAQLTLDSLKNAQFRFGVKELADVYSKDSLKLTNGKYYFALPQGAAREEYLAKLDEKTVAFGDADNDGLADAAVILVSMAGKNRVYQTLAVLVNRDGVAEYLAGADLETGAAVDSLSLGSGRVGVMEKLPGSGEVKSSTYRIEGGELVKD